MLKKGDIILISGILMAVIAGYILMSIYESYNMNEHKVAVIKQNNIILKSIDLDSLVEPEHFKVTGTYSETILIEKGRIRFEEANCPDLLCVKTGWLSKKGDTAACVPNRTVIKIAGDNTKVDGVTY